MMLHYITQYLSKYSIGFYKRCLASKGKRKLEKKSTVIYTRPISSFISTSILLLHDYHKNSLLFDFSSSSLYPSEVSFVTSSVPISYNTIRHTYHYQLLLHSNSLSAVARALKLKRGPALQCPNESHLLSLFSP